MKKHFLLVISALALGLSGTTFAASNCGGVIHFAKGESSTSISGKVAGYDICKYVFYAGKGGTLTVSMGKHDRPLAFLYSPVEQTLADGQPFILPKDGKYELRVGMTRNDARKYSSAQPFTMKFSIIAPHKTETQQVNVATSGLTGNYQAVLPCITCKGVDTNLALYGDGSYTLSEQYLGRGKDASYTQQGDWMVYGKAIVLQPKENADSLYLIAKDGDVYFVSQEEAGAAYPKVQPNHRLKRDK